ncbi:hypothetical protein FRC04_004128 [Tulasnella sp. 424]|nr:hypothetical protein FRC04_004128 [Tulasnella sp. 424]KAG8964346.1 hypothetical protein FRC05_003840 [Tulasnella sp. 425]
MAPFISSSITTLELEIKPRKEEAGSLFDFLQGSAPNIQELAITSHHPVDDFDLPLSLWISSLQNLTKLSLPPYYKSTNIVAAAGGLRVLKIFSRTENGFGIPNENGMQMEFQPDTFPELRALEWNSTLPNAIQLLQPSPRVEALESLHLSCSGSNPPTSEVLAFTRGLGKACPRLREITLDLFPDVWTPPLLTEQPLGMGVLDGLAPCQELAVLRVRHPLPTKLDENDVHLIGATWKKLECLVLCPNPSPLGRWSPTGISISVLPLLANALPNLTHLGLLFDFNEAIKFSGDLYPQNQFKNLQTLEVGFSDVPRSEIQDLGSLLASLCNLSAPTIDVSRDRKHGPPYLGDNPRMERWEQVRRNLDMAMRIKICGWRRMGGVIA